MSNSVPLKVQQTKDLRMTDSRSQGLMRDLNADENVLLTLMHDLVRWREVGLGFKRECDHP